MCQEDFMEKIHWSRWCVLSCCSFPFGNSGRYMFWPKVRGDSWNFRISTDLVEVRRMILFLLPGMWCRIVIAPFFAGRRVIFQTTYMGASETWWSQTLTKGNFCWLKTKEYCLASKNIQNSMEIMILAGTGSCFFVSFLIWLRHLQPMIRRMFFATKFYPWWYFGM